MKTKKEGGCHTPVYTFISALFYPSYTGMVGNNKDVIFLSLFCVAVWCMTARLLNSAVTVKAFRTRLRGGA